MRTSVRVAAFTVALVVGVSGSALASHVFRDVPDSSTHAEAIHWAQANGIITGFGDGTFQPRTTVLRDQVASMLHRYDQHVERRIAAAATPLAPLASFAQANLILDPGGRHVPMPVHVADTPELRQRGLMGVEHLEREGGMLFVNPGDTSGGFWMRDTLIPLSIAFLAADGTVLAILDMEPCTADPCPVHDPGVSYRNALEVNQGRFGDLGLTEPGWRVDIPAHLQPGS